MVCTLLSVVRRSVTSRQAPKQKHNPVWPVSPSRTWVQERSRPLREITRSRSPGEAKHNHDTDACYATQTSQTFAPVVSSKTH